MPKVALLSVGLSILLLLPVSADPVADLRESWGPRLLNEASRDLLVQRAGGAVPPTHRQRASFLQLAGPLTALEIFRTVGVPDADVGHGVHLYLYALSDGSFVRVWASAFDTPTEIRIFEPDGTERVIVSQPAR